jgi:hypothetical protein
MPLVLSLFWQAFELSGKPALELVPPVKNTLPLLTPKSTIASPNPMLPNPKLKLNPFPLK